MTSVPLLIIKKAYDEAQKRTQSQGNTDAKRESLNDYDKRSYEASYSFEECLELIVEQTPKLKEFFTC